MTRSSQVDAQAQEVRELLAEVRGATKDLRRAIRDAKEVYAGLAEEVMAPHMAAELSAMMVRLSEVQVLAEERLLERFEALTQMLLHGVVNGRKDHPDLEQLVHAAIAQKNGSDR